MKYSENAAGASAFGHSTLTPFTRQDARNEIHPKAASTSGTRSTPRCFMSRNAGTSSRHTTESTVAVKFMTWMADVAPIANTATWPEDSGLRASDCPAGSQRA